MGKRRADDISGNGLSKLFLQQPSRRPSATGIRERITQLKRDCRESAVGILGGQRSFRLPTRWESGDLVPHEGRGTHRRSEILAASVGHGRIEPPA